MDDFTLISNCHGICDDHMATAARNIQTALDSDKDITATERFWERTKQVNDHAYFCLLAFQLEQFVRESFSHLCEAQLTTTTGVDRIAWERIKTSKADFLTMVKFLLPGDVHLYNRARELYRDRNKIAHEAELSLPIQMSTAQQDIEGIALKIRSALPTPEAAP